MSTKTFLAAVIGLLLLVSITSPPLLRPFFQHEPSPTATIAIPSPTPTSTPTLDPFASVPTATPRAQGIVVQIQQLPAASVGNAPPTFTPAPEGSATLLADVPDGHIELLPDPEGEAQTPDTAAVVKGSALAGLQIPKLQLDTDIQPVHVASVPGEAAGVVAGGMPATDDQVGWINTSAPFGLQGNMVLTGRHHSDAAFYNLWTLAAGDEITLSGPADRSTGSESRRYIVDQIFIMAEQQEPLEVRTNNAEHIRSTEDERLTLVTGWEEKPAYRTVVIAFPEQKRK